jgi:hypothetical protein
MADYLRLMFNFDDDGTAELHAQVSASGFSGIGSACFNVSQVSDLAEVLGKAFPLQGVVELKGGYWGRESGSGLEQEHLALRFYSAAGRGVVGCQVRLATPLIEHERPEVQHSVRVEFTTSYPALQQFSRELLRAAKGELPEAVLVAAEV